LPVTVVPAAAVLLLAGITLARYNAAIPESPFQLPAQACGKAIVDVAAFFVARGRLST